MPVHARPRRTPDDRAAPVLVRRDEPAARRRRPAATARRRRLGTGDLPAVVRGAASLASRSWRPSGTRSTPACASGRRASPSCFYDTSLPAEVIEAVAANLTILKSPTVLRQADGRLWAWEGCNDNSGCCHGSCTHVWNYAQALPHLFPALERTLRETEFSVSQDARGHQTFRAALPIRPTTHDFHAAADGQLGGIMKVYREWRITGDLAWLRGLWPRVRTSLDYCIETWDPRHRGVVEEPHHNTYDIEFWGPDGMCSSFYLGALRAGVLMGEALGAPVPLYAELAREGPQGRRGRAVERRVLRPEDRVEDAAREEPARDEELRRRVLARGGGSARAGGAEVPVRRRLPLGRRARRVARRGLRRRRGPGARQGREPRARGPPPQPPARPDRAREPAAADVRLRRGRRAAALHLAARRRPHAAVRLQRTRCGRASSTRWRRT